MKGTSRTGLLGAAVALLFGAAIGYTHWQLERDRQAWARQQSRRLSVRRAGQKWSPSTS
jgi:hypothetical protein